MPYRPPRFWQADRVVRRGRRAMIPLQSDLYEDDILLWPVRQSELLRRLAGGERVNDQID
jgi:hypothetical protein